MTIFNMVGGSWGGSVPVVYKWEMIVYKMNADDSWNLYVPTSWYNHSWSMASPYSWKVSIDGWTETTYSWTWSSRSAITLSWYTSGSSHTIKIKPTTESYWWALAFWWWWTPWRTYLTEVLYDWSYMWYWVSATDAWDYFKYSQYSWCTNLTKIPDEVMPDTVTTIWRSFMSSQCGSTWLLESPKEYISNSVTTIWNYFRAGQYSQCTSLVSSWEESLPSTVTSIWIRFRFQQYQGCTALTEIKWWKDISVWNSESYRYRQYNDAPNKTVKVLSNVWYSSFDDTTLPNKYVTSVSVPSAYLTTFKNTSNYPWAWITDSKFVWY